MFGLSLEQLLVLLVAALFVLGPERLPGAVSRLARVARQAREFAVGAQQRLEAELGPEFRQLRKPLQELQALREFDPRLALRYPLPDERPVGAPATGLRPGERPPVDPEAT
ncbi:Sec-independent protein translocase TatB [Amycolatopsis mongoliensis]|uniref:Sec-independent protein translocase TatB n=1 Tax=Amycolatopsis mongoliensis TaxID=715475 RepID=A0A9Y2JK81_9PSEU|nr:Sec-independent protein translocase TatB [Amycolatopsis sp. 4-36]WIX98796.1 Sec-independent protein translocase TatB [Amycolatopsis sp. 4-36]